MTWRVRCSLAAMLLPGLVAAAGAGVSGQQERLRLVHADQRVGETVGGLSIRRLEGNVVFRQGSTEMQCDRAVQYVEQGRVIFEGNVWISRPGQDMRADRIEYLERTREEWAVGNVEVRDSLRVLRCDRLHYQEGPEFGVAEGNVELYHESTRVRLLAGLVRYYRLERRAEGLKNPMIVQEDSTGRVVFTLTGNRLLWLEDSKRFVATGNVRIEQEQSWATCDSLVYERDEGLAVLRGRPETWRRWERMIGVEMEWYFADDTLREVRVRGDALVLTEADTLNPGTRVNRVRGDSIRIEFSGGEPSRVVVQGRATSLYYLFEEGKPKGASWILGDEIILWTSGGEIERVQILGSPEAAEGKYFPERIVHLAPVSEFPAVTVRGQQSRREE